MRNRLLSVLTIFILFTMLLADCRLPDAEPKQASGEASDVSLDVWIFFDQNTPGTHYLDIWTPIGEELGYQINVKTFASEELQDKLRISLVCDELPDIFSVWGGTFPDYLIDAEACLPIQDYIENSGLPFQDSYTVPYRDGNNYIIPCLVEAYAITYCNNSLMNAVGVEPPEDWSSLMDLIGKTNRYNSKNGTNYAAIELGNKDNWLGELLYAMIVNRMDPYALDKLISGELQFSDDIFLAAAKKCVELVDAGAFPDDFLETGEVEAMENFINNESLLFPHQTTITFHLLDNMGTDAITSIQFPSCNDIFSPDYGSYLVDINHTLTPGLCISQNTSYPDEAAEICLKFAEAVNEINVTEYGYINFMDKKLPVPENLPKPVTDFTSMVEHAEKFTSFWYALLPRSNANEWRSLTKRLFAKAVTPEEFIAEGARYLTFIE